MNLRDPYGNLFKEFIKSQIYLDSYRDLDRMCYWEAGEYTLEMTVSTSKPNKSFKQDWRFTLKEQDVKLVLLNTVKLLLDTCGRPSEGNYFFAYVQAS
jgi:hypothetical protein